MKWDYLRFYIDVHKEVNDFHFYLLYKLHVEYIKYRLGESFGLLFNKVEKNTDNLVHAFALKHKKMLQKILILDKIVIRDIA